MPKTRIEYKNYEKMIAQRAWKWKSRTGQEIEDLIAEGNLVFCKCIRDYDKKQSAFGTFLYNSLQMHFGNIANTSRYQKTCKPYACVEFDEAENNLALSSYTNSCAGNAEEITIFRQLLDNFSSDAKEVCKAVFETPLEIISEMGVTRITKYALQKYFARKGWQTKRIWDAFGEIQKEVR